jgi:hypothetical protein
MNANIENTLGTLKYRITQLSEGDRWMLLKWLVELLQQEQHPLQQEETEVNVEAIRQICHELRGLPVLDDRSPDEIIGYNQFGGLD